MKEVIKAWIKKLPIAFTKNQKYDRLTNKVIKRICQPQSNCIDVGCHKGVVLETILKYAPEGQHYGFEPIPEMYQTLVKRFPENCHFYQIALSNKKGKTSFNHVLSNPAYSGFKQHEYPRAKEKVIKIDVQTAPLDAIIPANLPIDLIKIDVEGAELQVLQGAEATIRRCQPVIIFEHGKGAADFYDTSPIEVFDFMTACGLDIMLLENFLEHKKAFTKAQFITQFEEHLNYYFIACKKKLV